MPQWVRSALCVLIVLGVLKWGATAYYCVRDHFVAMDREDSVKRTMTAEEVNAKIDVIASRHLPGAPINVVQHAHDVIRLEYLREHVSTFASGTRRHIDVLAHNMCDETVQQGKIDEISLLLNRIRGPLETEPVEWGAIGLSLLNFLLWCLSFTPLAFLILLLKHTAEGESLAWAIASMREKPGQVIAAMLFLPGLMEYRPHTPLPEQVQEVADAMARLRIRKPERNVGWHNVEDAFFFRNVMPSLGQLLRSETSLLLPCWVADCFRFAGVIFQYIWGRPSWSWCRLAIAVFRYPRLCSQAVYVTLAAMICVVLGSVPLVEAAEAAGKEVKLSDPVVRGAMLQYVDQPGGGVGTASILLFLKGFDGGDIEVDVFGFNQPDPVLELSHVFPMSIKGIDLKSGPFVDLVRDRVTAYGIYSLLFDKVGSGSIGGPLYFSWTTDGELTCYTPHFFGFWGVNGSKRWQAGFDSVISVTEGIKPNVLFGPAIQYKPTNNDRIFVGFGEWLSGAFSGRRWRVEWGHAF